MCFRGLKAHVYNTSTFEEETEESGTQVQPQLYSKFESRIDYLRPFQKTIYQPVKDLSPQDDKTLLLGLSRAVYTVAMEVDL